MRPDSPPTNRKHEPPAERRVTPVYLYAATSFYADGTPLLEERPMPTKIIRWGEGFYRSHNGLTPEGRVYPAKVYFDLACTIEWCGLASHHDHTND
jgi:hypothetical protein